MNPGTRHALFADLIFNEEGEPVKTAYVGDVPHYAIPDGDFMRHVEAEYVDRQIIVQIQERVMGMRDVIVEGVVQMLGEENPFTRASIEHAIEHMDRILEVENLDVDELRTAFWMTGFRATVNIHGDVVSVYIPGLTGEWEA